MNTFQVSERPYPPDSIFEVDEWVPKFVPDPILADWVHKTFVSGTGPLVHETHAHLGTALIGCVWTNVLNNSKMREIVATCEVFPHRTVNVQGGKWKRGRSEAQLIEWFGMIPDVMLTFYAPFASVVDDAGWCAVVEHELCHAAQARDECGGPKFTKDGMPIFGARGHDVEEFVHVVERYGVTHGAAGMTGALVQAAMRPPSVARADIGAVCGTCLRLVA